MELDAAVAAIAAEERPDVDVGALLEQLDDIASGVRMPPEVRPEEAVARLNLRLFSELGFKGDMDSYEHPMNSMLDQVLERRRGLPILLSVVYIEVARRCGVAVEGVGFPGHFLVTIPDADTPFFIDPFNEGRILTREVLVDRLTRMTGSRPSPAEVDVALRRSDPKYILVRINNNLKGAYLRRDEVPAAIRAVRRMLAQVPHLPTERRDLALMTAHEGDVGGAIAELEAYLAAHPDAPGAAALTELARQLGGPGIAVD